MDYKDFEKAIEGITDYHGMIAEIAEHFGKYNQLNKFDEETHELLEACTGYGLNADSKGHIEEEFADVLVVLAQLFYLYRLNGQKINKNVYMKLKRTKKRISEGYYDRKI